MKYKRKQKHEKRKESKRERAEGKVEQKVKFDDITKIADAFGVSHDEIKCGRMRQPISIVEDNCYIEGICSLDGRECSYVYPFKYEDCERQQKIMSKYIQRK